MKKQKSLILCGVQIDGDNMNSVLRHIQKFAQIRTGKQIVSLTAHALLWSRDHQQYRQILNNSDLRVVDGMAIKLVVLILRKKVSRYTGADLMFDVLRLAEQHGWSVYFVCLDSGLSDWKTVSVCLERKYPNLKAVGGDWNFAQIDAQEFQSSIKADIVFCNFGQPHQEIFLSKLPKNNFGIAIGVGGAFDFLTNKINRAPKILRKLGLEWTWRTITQPKRIGKMLRSVVIFPIVALRDWMRGK